MTKVVMTAAVVVVMVVVVRTGSNGHRPAARAAGRPATDGPHKNDEQHTGQNTS